MPANSSMYVQVKEGGATEGDLRNEFGGAGGVGVAGGSEEGNDCVDTV